MKRISCMLLTFHFIFFAAAAWGAEQPLYNFAKGYRLQVDGKSAIYQLALPEEVYKTVVRSDLGDVRVFNSDGESVPHAIRKQESIETREAVHLQLPFFPFNSDVKNFNADKNVDIMVAGDGTIVRINNRGDEYVAQNSIINSYLIDLSGLHQSIDELEFELAGSEGSYIKKLSLKASNDLNHWQYYVPNATLVKMDYGGHSLIKNRIKVPNRRPKYLRLDWIDRSNGIQVTAVRATLNTAHTIHMRKWSRVSGLRSKDNDQIIEFDTGGLYPIDRINVALPERNSLIEATLSSRPNKKANWTPRYSGLFYNLQVQDNLLKPEPVSVRLSTDRYWQLQIRTRGGLGARLPVLAFGWLPNDLYFLARGDGPYTLAFGNGQVGAPGRPIDALMRVLGDNQSGLLMRQARLMESVELLGDAALAPELSIPWLRILLWAILIAGVLVLGFMAYRLLKQLNAAA